MKLDTIEAALDDLKHGKMVIVVDDENRENEGDVILPAQYVTPETINMMIKMSSGLLCVPMTQEVANKFELPPMVNQNTAHFKVNFTISIDAAEGISTGASVYDKAHTIQLLTKKDTHANMFVSPGHVFPLVAKPGGVLQRAGHTEAAVDLMKLANLDPIAVITEITNEDGSMARLPELSVLAQKLNIKLISVKDLITYRYNTEQILQLTTSVRMPTRYGEFTLHMFENEIGGVPCFALTKGIYSSGLPTLIRIHSECFTGDIFASLRCDCGQQLDAALTILQKQEFGMLIYMKQEGRGIGLENKIKAYKMQDNGFDTIEANHQLGFPADLRDYAFAAQVLKYFSVNTVRLLTNNSSKITNLTSYGINIIDRVPLEVAINNDNYRYLNTKKYKMGHLFSQF